MLHRSFKPAKCKTSLKLAVSRIKLLKNKKDAQVKQIKRELAQLLETGQERTARIRVEHVLREEKTKAAYELIEIYCELIAARLPMIESQKNCPIDLKEAITSVVFASPRCADIPELMDVRKHFTAKYGKEFISGAVELRPDCGVNRMLVEKLSAKSPDGPTKMKILAAIAEEHNVKWDPESFEEKESKPPEDLLNGPNTFGSASKIHVEPPRGPPPPNHDVKEPSNVQVPPQSYENHDVSMNFNQQSARSSPRFRDSASSNVSSNKATASDTFHPEVRSSGNRTDGTENRHSFHGDGNTSSMGRQNWNMNFKDAASAAQAAAESAEMASMAARAAAELSRQHSSESRDEFSQSASLTSSRTSINNDPSLNSHQMADRYPQRKSSEPEKRDSIGEMSTKSQSSNTDVYASEMQTGRESDNVSYFGDMGSEEKSSRHSSQSNSIGEVSTKRQSSNIDVYASEMQTGRESDNVSYFGDMGSEEKSSRRPSQSNSIGEVSTKRQSSNIDVYDSEMQTGRESDHVSYFGDMGSEEKSSWRSSQSNSIGEVSMKRQSSNIDVYLSEMQTAKKPDNISYFGNMRSEEKSSRPASQSNSSFGSDDQEDVLRGNDHISYSGDMRTGEQFARSHSRNSSNDHVNVSTGLGEDSFVGDANIYQSTKQMNSYGNAALVFDDSGSDDDKYKFDVEDFKGQESSFYFPSPDRNSFSSSAHLNDWSSKHQTDEVQFKSTSQLSSSLTQHSPPVFSENLTGSVASSEPNDLLPVAFDASAGPSSDSEEEVDKSKLSQSTVSKFSSGQSHSARHRSFGSSSSEELNLGSNQKSWLLPSSLNLNSVDVQPERSQGVENSTASEEKFDYDELPTGEPSRGLMKSGLDSNVKDDFQTLQLPQTVKDSEVSGGCSCVSDSDNELNYGTLTGGLRNKGYKHPPFTRKPSGNSLFVKQVTEDTKIEQPSHSPKVRTSIVSGASSQEPNNLRGSTKLIKERSRRTQVSYIAPDDDSSGDELSHGIVSSGKDPFNKKLGSEAKASSKSTFGFFDSEDSEGEEDLHTKISTSNARPSAKLSRRTQPSSSNSVRSSSSKTAVVSDVSRTSEYGKVSSRSSYATETLPKSSSHTKSSERSGSREWNRPAEQAAPEPIPESQRSSPVETSKSYRNSSSRSSYPTETVPKPLSQTKSSERPGSQEWHRPAEEAAPKPIPESKRSSPVETSNSYGNPSSRSSYATETVPKPLSQTKSSERPGSQEWHRPAEEANPKPILDSKRSSPAETSKSYGNPSSRSSYATETLPKPSSQTKGSERPGSQEWHRPAEEAAPKPIAESKRSSTIETSKSYGNPSYATETLQRPLSQTKSSMRPGSQERHRPVEQAASKPIPESKRSSVHVETSKSFPREQSSSLSPKIATARSTETPKSSGPTVESAPKEKASHVHPKLPDSDAIIAKFMALRQSRQ
ncbi:hypothetical protein L3X38_039958 [Prunus dulcis]|uniref:Regulator of Vps4 activity in the MVB pathway protein n=1 Tax=Prunus dulcis TaxID=3755 RepID=A0AAD4V831_PRUDU|nr:hypothetical protein L3X38_039958 [Prunus dulcis]